MQCCAGVDMACYLLLGTETRKTVVGVTLLTLSEILVIQAVRLGQARGHLSLQRKCLLQPYDISQFSIIFNALKLLNFANVLIDNLK
jgi:hypothetical protein